MESLLWWCNFSYSWNGIPPSAVFYIGGTYGNEHKPNWSHRYCTPCPGSPHWADFGTRGEHFEAGNLSAPISPLLLVCANDATTLSIYWILGLSVNDSCIVVHTLHTTFHVFSRTMILYSVKSYYASNLHSAVRLNHMLHVCVLVSRSADILYPLT